MAQDIAERGGILFCLVGPAGGGKTTIASRLIEGNAGTLRKSVSVTSRAKRPNEVDGVSYHFVSREEFERRVAAGLFFEWEEVHGNLYGTLRASLDEAVAGRHDLALDIDIKGALNLRRAFPRHAVISFVLPPSVQDSRSRILARGSVSAEELERRLETARVEYRRILEQYSAPDSQEYLILNKDLESAVATAQSILTAERRKFHRISSASINKICAITE